MEQTNGFGLNDKQFYCLFKDDNKYSFQLWTKGFSHHFLCFYCQLYLYAYGICIAIFPRKPLSVQSGKYLILKENLDSDYDLKS